MPRTTCLNSDSALPCTDGPRLERLGQEAFQIVHLCARPQRNAERVVADAALPTLFWGFECEGPAVIQHGPSGLVSVSRSSACPSANCPVTVVVGICVMSLEAHTPPSSQ